METPTTTETTNEVTEPSNGQSMDWFKDLKPCDKPFGGPPPEEIERDAKEFPGFGSELKKEVQTQMKHAIQKHKQGFLEKCRKKTVSLFRDGIGGFLAKATKTVGQFFKKRFRKGSWWHGLADFMARQAFAAFMKACGKAVWFYAEQNAAKDPAPQTSEVQDKAFGSQPTNGSGYTPASSYPVNPSPGGDNRFKPFPGF